MDSILTSTAISFVISYVAGCLPTPIADKSKSMNDRLKKCYIRAIKNWDVPQAAKDKALNDMDKYLRELSETIKCIPKGKHPKVCELLRLWADEILADPDCNQFIIVNKQELIHAEIQKGLIKVEDVLDTLRVQNEEINQLIINVQRMSSRGVTDARTYWEIWSTGVDSLKLNYNIVLAGRENVSEVIENACKIPMYICLESSSQSDAMAFTVATILDRCKADAERTFIIENADVYRDFIMETTPLIIITNVMENPYYAVSKGHTIIWCGTPADKIAFAEKFVLPIVDRDGFRESLMESGIDDNTISHLLLDTKRESALLRRALNINSQQETWMIPEYSKYYLPALLIGAWDESRSEDKNLVSQMAGMDYVTFENGAQILLNSSEPPLLKIGSVWQVSSPKLLMSRLLNNISLEQIERFKACLDWVMEDDDPDALKKRESTTLQFWRDNHLLSEHIRKGLFQSITILAVVQEAQGISNQWIAEYIAGKLKGLTFERFLSKRSYLKWMAECSPDSFIAYIENDLKTGAKVLNKVFEVKHTDFGLIGSEIYYSELLFCLECLAWDYKYLPAITEILLNLSRYPNDSNYSNKPVSSLYSIYRFLLPQTLVDFDKKFNVLQLLSKKYSKEVGVLCYKMLDGLKQTVFMSSSHFRWRSADKIKSCENIEAIPVNQVIHITELLLSAIEYSEENICQLISLSMSESIMPARDLFLDKFKSIIEDIRSNEKIADFLRKEIHRLQKFKKSRWAIGIEGLAPYIELLKEIEPDDIIKKNKHYFDDYLIEDANFEGLDEDFQFRVNKSRQFRKDILKSIVEAKGWDGIWDLFKSVENTDGLAEAIVELSNDDKRYDIYQYYCLGILDNKFVRKYFQTLFYDFGKDTYLQYIRDLKSISEEHIGVILYAPNILQEIISIVEKESIGIQKEYWNNIYIWDVNPDQILYVINNLRAVDRYSEILRLVYQKEYKQQISEKMWLDILFEVLDKGKLPVLYKDDFYVAEILKGIKIPDDPRIKNKLMQLELLLFDYLRHHLNRIELHLLVVANSEPEMMIELLKLAYWEDDEVLNEKELSEVEMENRVLFAQLAWNFLYHYQDVPGMQQDGSLDEDFLINYLTNLKKLAKESHRIDVMPLIVGRILGNIPEGDDYPPDIMCELVELFNNDNIDTEISCCLSNKRGMSTRSPFAGGEIERGHVEIFKAYRERSLIRSPRLVKVFENEIKYYEYMAKHEDERGRLTDLMY